MEEHFNFADCSLDVFNLRLKDLKLSIEALLFLRAELLERHVHLLESFLFINKIIFLVFANLQGVYIVNERLKRVGWFVQGVLNLTQRVQNIFRLLVSQVIKVASNATFHVGDLST